MLPCWRPLGKNNQLLDGTNDIVASQEMTMVLEGEKLPELDEVDLETIFNEVKSEDLACPGDLWGVITRPPKVTECLVYSEVR